MLELYAAIMNQYLNSTNVQETRRRPRVHALSSDFAFLARKHLLRLSMNQCPHSDFQIPTISKRLLPAPCEFPIPGPKPKPDCCRPCSQLPQIPTESAGTKGFCEAQRPGIRRRRRCPHGFCTASPTNLQHFGHVMAMSFWSWHWKLCFKKVCFFKSLLQILDVCCFQKPCVSKLPAS